jgi:cob(I)alamin adenosyltransferase
MIKNLLVGGLMIVIPVTGIIAEEAAPAVTDIEARRQSVVDLESHIAQREQRLAEWGKDIVELNARIEKRVDELVNLLAGLRDSQDSRRRVTQIKKEAIEGLEKGIERYRSKRKEIREMVRTGSDEALGDLGKIDEHIIKRIDQIAELTKSIPAHEDVEKYESDGGSYWNGYYDGGRVSEEWKQNRRDSSASDKQRKDTAEALEKAIKRLEERRRSLKSQLAEGGLTESAKTLYVAELGQIDAYEAHLQSLQGDVIAGGGSAGGRAIGLEQAQDIENMIKDARTDLREDAARLFRSYDQFVRGRHYLEGLKENLAARKAWLLENDTKKTGTP